MTLDDDQKRRSDECWENDWDYLDGVEGAISIHKDKMPPEPDHQTQLKELVNLCLPAGPTKNSIQRVPIKELTVEPLCSLEEANKNFNDKYLDDSHVKIRLSESTLIKTQEGETKFLFLKNVIPTESVESAWQMLPMLRFRPAKSSRRLAIRDSGGGECLLGWIEFPRQDRSYGPIVTADTKNSWPEFRQLWPLFWTINELYRAYLPKYARIQSITAAAARESELEYMSRFCKLGPNIERWKQLQAVHPELVAEQLCNLMEHMNPGYMDAMKENIKFREYGPAWAAPLPGITDGDMMRGYTVPGTMFSTITVNQAALFKSHEDGNNLEGTLACLAAFGSWSGADLCFLRFGVSCPLEPGDLLIGDTNREQHGNLGPLFGQRISVVAYMRDDLTKYSD